MLCQEALAQACITISLWLTNLFNSFAITPTAQAEEQQQAGPESNRVQIHGAHH